MLTPQEIKILIDNDKASTKRALQTVYDSMNQGQQKKLIKNETVKTLFDRYGVEYNK